MSVGPVTSPEPLGAGHKTAGFFCGAPALDRYLAEWALADQRADKSRTYVVSRGSRVVGYFTLAAASIDASEATSRAAHGQGMQPVPAVLLARLAVDRSEQGRGLGEALLLDALRRAAAAADAIGARVVLVHAKDSAARDFYIRYGFESSPTGPLQLMLLMKDVRRSLKPD